MAPSQSTPAPVTSTVSNFIQQVSATNLTTTAVVAAPAPVPAAIEVPAAATNQVASAVSPNGQLLERAKALSADQKYMEAASLLGTVNSQDLTGEEKSLWQSLQAQVRKALAAETAKSASDSAAKSGGGLFGK